MTKLDAKEKFRIFRELVDSQSRLLKYGEDIFYCTKCKKYGNSCRTKACIPCSNWEPIISKEFNELWKKTFLK